MVNVSTQMAALDEFVTRARSQNGLHHESHTRNLAGLAETVRETLKNVGTEFAHTHKRISTSAGEMSTQTEKIRSQLQPLAEATREPLSELRENITGVPLKEYVPTGETPMKMQYQYTASLPRTDSHSHLLAKLRNGGEELPTQDEETQMDLDLHQEQQSPSKGQVFHDASVENEDIDDQVELLKTPDPQDSKPTQQLGLREIDRNIAALGTIPSTSSIAVKFDGSKSLNSTPNTGTGLMAPPLKRPHTSGPESKLPTKLGKVGRSVTAEGVENKIPMVQGNTTGPRRLRNSPRLVE
jgi:kinesin family member 11